ncbi:MULTISPECIES: glycosyltransferase family 1 protein [unclassified Mesorhizobium]|uniref:glycosyltransferase family 4 protein n=1 Tax=unclassified Mesorhizobium TaxID=325217 RepID=UPI0015E34BFA|nr:MULTISPECIES: glycosyltransferase family 1 protein [unclassified Mesorhizobium]MCA0023551.1 glycosyltransferase family 4 protein [Mesorhizobium sp. B263B1A]
MDAAVGARGGSVEASPRVFVDVTTSLMLAGQTRIGISRVEGELARRLINTSEFNAIPVVFRPDGVILALSREQADRIFNATPIYEAPSVSVLGEMASSDIPLSMASGDSGSALAAQLRLRVTGAMRRICLAAIARTPASIRDDVRAILIHMRQIARRALYRNKAPAPGIPAPLAGSRFAPLRDEVLPALRAVVYPRHSDVLWTAGLYSNFVPLRRIGEIRKRTGLRVVTTCYDLIRVTHHQYNPSSMHADLFAADAVAMLDTSDLVFAISDWSRRELVAFSNRVGRPVPEIKVIQLGSDLSEPLSQTDLIVDLPFGLSDRRFGLTVGTIEPRKNYRLLLRIWERLSKDPNFLLDLVIVGRPGFESDESVLELTGSPLFGRRIHWLRDCSDGTLRHLYQASDVLVYPTFVEGWGLPVTEALSFGCPVIASDRGAIPEAGHSLVQLLDPNDEESWAKTIAQVRPRQHAEPLLKNPPTWDAAAAQVEKQLMRFMKSRKAA